MVELHIEVDGADEEHHKWGFNQKYKQQCLGREHFSLGDIIQLDTKSVLC